MDKLRSFTPVGGAQVEKWLAGPACTSANKRAPFARLFLIGHFTLEITHADTKSGREGFRQLLVPGYSQLYDV